MSDFDFTKPSRQSAKGIFVIFGVSTFKFIKGSIIIFVALILKYVQSDKGPDLSNPFLILGVLVLGLLFLLYAVLQYLNFKFYLNNDYFFLKKGIVNKEEVSVSFLKIQNVYIKQNLLQQLINVVSLSIETAGDDKTEIEITALEKSKAYALKQQLLVVADIQTVTSASEEVPEADAYYKASISKLLLEGISENHFKSFLLIFAFLTGVYNDLREFVNRFDFLSGFKEWFNLDSESIMTLIVFNIGIIIALLLISVVFSLVKMLIKNFDLTVLRTQEGLEISKGLFNKIHLSLTASRIQTTTVSTNRLKKFLGLHQLAFTQAMTNKKQQQNFNIVGLNFAQISELISQFYPKSIDDNIKYKPDRYLEYRIYWIAVMMLMPINIVFYYTTPWLFLLNIPLGLYIYFKAIITFKKAYYYFNDEFIMVGGGNLIDTRTKYLEIHKIQGIMIKQTIFQKQRHLGTLQLFSASKSISIPQMKVSEALNLKNYLLYLVESRDKNWM